MKHAGGDRVMAQVLAAVPTAGLETVLVAVDLVVESGALSAEHVLNVVARLNAKPTPDSVETILALKEPPLANISGNFRWLHLTFSQLIRKIAANRLRRRDAR